MGDFDPKKVTGFVSTAARLTASDFAAEDISEARAGLTEPKASVTLTHDKERPVLGIPGLNRLQLFVSSTFRSGQRYTPVEFQGQQVNPFTGERDWRPVYETNSDPAKRFSEMIPSPEVQSVEDTVGRVFHDPVVRRLVLDAASSTALV